MPLRMAAFFYVVLLEQGTKEPLGVAQIPALPPIGQRVYLPKHGWFKVVSLDWTIDLGPHPIEEHDVNGDLEVDIELQRLGPCGEDV